MRFKISANKIEVKQMIEQIFPDLYRIEIPLPRNPLKALNAYVIKSPDRNLIIDTGWNMEACMSAMRAGLRELEVDLKKTEFFITHLHADHLGLVENLFTEATTVYFSSKEAAIFNSIMEHIEKRKQ